MPTHRYENDFYAWSQEQAVLLRAGRWSELQIGPLSEEIEDLGKRERRALESRLVVLIGHLLKWVLQPDYPYRKSWRATINEQRRNVARLLAENPSLQPLLPELVTAAYADSRDLVVRETPLDYDVLPTTCPFTIARILDNAFWPVSY
ncbi:DUF29 domain-containing protein [Thiorhodovibrio frisius]|uniref:DUF29 domain-containing protein n=1 Tax=Thiorhodovibrio frisius TaxID=631362 RepID=H8Z593_9GAMM|nr:DUF29 domain-containing protein [Thiorhodovibrio frisius]EIC20500.1 protein of unknown function DUF29 [Thiorhodovibrio frisius]WPL21241.1 hypothetical protein Thiofri_01353 [Thiorhodovibrio frisius]